MQALATPEMFALGHLRAIASFTGAVRPPGAVTVVKSRPLWPRPSSRTAKTSPAIGRRGRSAVGGALCRNCVYSAAAPPSLSWKRISPRCCWQLRLLGGIHCAHEEAEAIFGVSQHGLGALGNSGRPPAVPRSSALTSEPMPQPKRQGRRGSPAVARFVAPPARPPNPQPFRLGTD